MVARQDEYGALQVITIEGRLRVRAHDRYTFKNTQNFDSLSIVNVRCEGGYVDTERDKAP